MPNDSRSLPLLISSIAILTIALAYGLFPSTTLPFLFDFNVDSTDLKGVFRATMGLYCAMAGLWFMGFLKPQLRKAATISNVVFMVGLAVGRVMSLIIDGVPSAPFLAGLFAELTLALWAYSI